MAECPGVYQLSSMRDGGLARVRIPGGHLTVQQFQTISHLAETYGNGQVDLTNRANIQIRGLDFADTPQLAQALQDCDLLCADPDADRIRNVTASPLAGIDETEVIDITQHVRQLDEALQSTTPKHNLSPKFAFVIDGGGCCSLADVGHDVGFYATDEAGVFSISLAGSMTNRTVTEDQLVAFSQAAIAYVVRSGRTRMADVLSAQTSSVVLEEIATAQRLDIARESRISRTNTPLPLGYHQGQSTASSWYCLGIPLARLTTDQIRAISGMENLTAGTLRLTPWQSIVLPGIDRTIASEIEREAHKHGFLTKTPAIRIVACAGCTGCERTQANTKADGRILIDVLSNSLAEGAPSRTVHMSGCPRGCAHPNTSDLLVLAQDGSANYAIHAGSRPSLAGQDRPIKMGVSPEKLAACISELCQLK